ncbi:hypothetical protein TYRP_017363 [Tyrophagus putrescentiae]|nr:hypothetical protein TYRP_017363 [Tyrophagus putrescentiae]
MSGVVSHLLNFEQVRQHIIVRREWLYRPLRSIADRRTALFWDDRWETFERRRASEEEEEDHHHQLNDTYLVRLSLEGFWVTVTQHSTIPPQEEEEEELEEREPTSQQMGTFLLPFASIESMQFDYLTSPGSPSRICFLFKSGCYLDRSGILTPPCFDSLDDPWRPERLAMNFRCEADRLRLLNTLLIACQVDYRESPRPAVDGGASFTVALLSEPLLGMVDRRRPPLVLESPQWVQEVGLEVPLRLLLETGKEDDLLEAIDQIKLKKEK